MRTLAREIGITPQTLKGFIGVSEPYAKVRALLAEWLHARSARRQQRSCDHGVGKRLGVDMLDQIGALTQATAGALDLDDSIMQEQVDGRWLRPGSSEISPHS